LKERNLPQSVLEAKLRGDIDRLRELGRRGGLATARKRRKQKKETQDFLDFNLERAVAGSREMRQQANEHIAPLD